MIKLSRLFCLIPTAVVTSLTNALKMSTIITKTEVLEQESKLYKAIKECDISMLDELLHNDLLFCFLAAK